MIKLQKPWIESRIRWILYLLAASGLMMNSNRPADAQQAEQTEPNTQSPPELFSSLGPGFEETTDIPDADSLLRRRPVGIDFDLLAAARDGQTKTIRLNLFGNAILDATVERTIIQSSGSYSLVGKIVGLEASSFILTVNEGIMLGNVRTGMGAIYDIRYGAGGIPEAREVDTSVDHPCGYKPELQAQNMFNAIAPISPIPPPPLALSQNCTGGGEYDDGSVIDVLVVWTPLARCAEAGGDPSDAESCKSNYTSTTQIETLVNLMITQVNVGYGDSNGTYTLPTINLIHKQEIDYDEVSDTNIHNDVNNLLSTTLPTGNPINDVHLIRDYYAADFVMLVVRWVGSSESGITGSQPTNEDELLENAPGAFAVLDHQFASTSLVFGHEMGHTMGSSHEFAAPSIYSYSLGWKFRGISPAVDYRTVMNTDSDYERINHYSNPDVLFAGKATGDEDIANNARSLSEVASVVSNWRPTIPTIYGISENGDRVLSFDEQGNFIIEADLIEQASLGQLTPASGDFWLIRDDQADVVARVDSNGNMYIKGDLTEDSTCPMTPSSEIVVIENEDDGAVAYIDDQGNLKLTGTALVWDGGPT